MTAEGLISRGIPESVVATVESLTRDPNIPYLDYVRGIAQTGGVSAIRVKLADNSDNGNPDRPDFPGRHDLMEKRYIPARRILEQAIRERGFFAPKAKACV